MSSNLPPWDTDLEDGDAVLPPSDRKKGNQQNQRSPNTSKSQERTLQAINDAQQGLHSLLNGRYPSAHDTQPHVISPSGAARNKRGRIAGPTADITAGPKSRRSNSPAGYLSSGAQHHQDRSLALALIPDSYEDESGEPDAVPQTAIGRGLATATRHIEALRSQANILIGPANGETAEYATPASRRAAAHWVTRYATHIVVVLVVGLLVALGGLKGLTVQGAGPASLQAMSGFTGTDHFGDDEEAAGTGMSSDSPDFQISLPRTDLAATTGNVTVSKTAQQTGSTAQGQAQGQAQAPARSGLITRYTVVKGDTIQSVANKFDVMPETIMGSNGIYDPDQEIDPGDVLNVPSVDGMFYVAKAGDTVESIAHRYQVDPETITSYKANNITGDTVQAGQQVVVPGGMMPPREQVLVYTVQPGDSLRDIAERFGIDLPTLLNSNDIADPDSLKIGTDLRILPVPGLQYKIKKGDTLRSIADKFSVPPQSILDYTPNKLTVASVLQIDQVIMVPGGKPPVVQVVVADRVQPSSGSSERPAQQTSSSSSSQTTSSVSAAANKVSSTKPKARVEASTSAPASQPPARQPQPKPQPKPQPAADTSSNDNTPQSGTGKMMWPVSAVITQYFSSRHNGLDLATAAGTPIHAADSGKIVWSGWRTDGLGYCVIIDHLNGLVTVYGHQIRQPIVYVGEYVSKGQIIGYVGSTGHSTGPHVHFMVKAGMGHDYRNPLAYLP